MPLNNSSINTTFSLTFLPTGAYKPTGTFISNPIVPNTPPTFPPTTSTSTSKKCSCLL